MTLLFFSRNCHPRHQELVFNRAMQRTSRIFNKTTLKTRQGFRKCRSPFGKCNLRNSLLTQVSVYICNLGNLKCGVENFLSVRCLKRLKTSSRGMGWQFRKKNEQGLQGSWLRKKTSALRLQRWSWRCCQVKLILPPKQRAKPAASKPRTCTNAAVCIASGECPSWFWHRTENESVSGHAKMPPASHQVSVTPLKLLTSKSTPMCVSNVAVF